MASGNCMESDELSKSLVECCLDSRIDHQSQSRQVGQTPMSELVYNTSQTKAPNK